MSILEKTKQTLLNKHPYNFTVMDEYSTEEQIVICGYPDVPLSDKDGEGSYLVQDHKWLLEKLENSKDDDEIDRWIWKLDWRKELDKSTLG